MKERRQRKVRVNKILRPVSAWLLVLLLQILLNFDSTCYLFNHGAYTEVDAIVAEEKTDPYLLLVPMLTMQYVYNGQTYTADKFFVMKQTFCLSGKKGSEMPVYVNELAPQHMIFKTNFFVNILNWILLFISICCIISIYRLIREKIENRKKRRAGEKGEKE